MELLLRIIVLNISTEYFSGIFQEKTFLKKCVESGQLCTLAPARLLRYTPGGVNHNNKTVMINPPGRTATGGGG